MTMQPSIFFVSYLQENGVVLTYKQGDKALEAMHYGVALIDRSHWGRISVAGPDCMNFMHNQTTNDFKRLKPGQGCDTVFVTATARTLELATAYVTANQVCTCLLASGEANDSIFMTYIDGCCGCCMCVKY